MVAPTDEGTALLALLVHELRTTANVVGGYLRMLEDPRSGPLSPHQASLVAHAMRSWALLGDVLADGSALARLRRGETRHVRESVQLDALVTAAVHAFAAPEPGGASLEAVPAAEQLAHPRPPARQGLEVDVLSLARAVASCARALARGTAGSGQALRLTVTCPPGATKAHLVLAPAEMLHAALSPDVTWEATDPFRYGLGLEWLLAQAVVGAAGGRIEQALPGRGVAALRVVLPVNGDPGTGPCDPR